jgi:hypothetical protein
MYLSTPKPYCFVLYLRIPASSLTFALLSVFSCPTKPAPPPVSPSGLALPTYHLFLLPLSLPPSFPAFTPPRLCQWPPLRSRFPGTILSPLIRFYPRSIIEAALSRPIPPIFVSVSVHNGGVGSPSLNPFLHRQQLFCDTSFSLSLFSTFYIARNGP